MAYVKINWTTTTARSTDNLEHMETQYDEAVAEGISLRADNTKELRVQVVASAPAGVAGQLYFNTANGQLYAYNGSAWTHIGPSQIANIYYINGTIAGGATTTTENIGAAVDLDRSIVQDVSFRANASPLYQMTAAWFLSDTQVRFSRKQSSATAISVSATVVEYYEGVIKQISRGNRNATGNFAVPAMDVDKTIIFHNQQGSNYPYRNKLHMVNSTTVSNDGTAEYLRYEVVELY